MKAAALPGFHAISGCDNTSSFSCKGKSTLWKAFKQASDAILEALGSREVELPSVETCDAIEKFKCGVCQPETDISKLSKLRWRMFCMKQANSYKLPPTRAALNQSILRAYHQAIVWHNDIEPNYNIPSPRNYGWKMESDQWVPIMTSEDPAPLSVLKVTQCNCVKSHCNSTRCSCRQGSVNCTDLCDCYNNEVLCSNMDHENQDITDEESDSDEEDSDNLCHNCTL